MLRALFELLASGLCTRDWCIVEDADGTVQACRSAETEIEDVVVRWELRKGQARRIARQMNERRNNTPEPIL